MNNKGAITTEWIKWLLNIFVIIVVIMFVFAVALSFLRERFETHDIEVFTLSRVFFYSENCLALSNDNRIIPGIIDLDKLTVDNLLSCYSKEGLGYTVSVTDLDNNEIKFVNPKFSINYYLPVCSALKEYRCSKNKYYILYKNNNKIVSGFLNLEVISLE